jgi:hypothetical protein
MKKPPAEVTRPGLATSSEELETSGALLQQHHSRVGDRLGIEPATLRISDRRRTSCYASDLERTASSIDRKPHLKH